LGGCFGEIEVNAIEPGLDFCVSAQLNYPMKGYLVTTGILFALITAAHVARAVAERSNLAVMTILIILPAALAFWAFSLFRKLSKSGPS
jgi:hypothetical protein